MGKTIIQTIGPLYGEAVNGTVFGRPNGSVYVPPSNTITISLDAGFRYVKNSDSPAGLVCCNASGTVDWSAVKLVAQSQDIANHIVTEVSESSDFSGTIYSRSRTAGSFNIDTAVVAFTSAITVVDEQTYYLRAQLVTAQGIAVATSDVIELEGVA